MARPSSSPSAGRPPRLSAGGARAVVGQVVRGGIVSGGFFRRYGLQLVVVLILLLVFITNKYYVQTRIETINALQHQLDVVNTQAVAQRSLYMSSTRESAMRRRVDSLRLGLSYQQQPPTVVEK